jgi:3-methyladenine DNA glycosylase AlkD
MTHPLVRTVRRALEQAADPAKAPQMQAYMKSTMPYRGVSSPVLRQLCREAFTAHPLPTVGQWQRVVLELWRDAAFREERYVAVLLTESRLYREFLTFDSVPMLEELIVTGAWWDFVDTIAGHSLGAILRAEPRRMKPLMRRWSKDTDMWKRRAVDPVSARVQARDGSQAPLRLHRAEPHPQGLLHQESDRLVPSSVRVDRSERSAALREGQQRSIERIERPRGDEEHQVKSSSRTRARSRSI